jgi:hypothetical protein
MLKYIENLSTDATAEVFSGLVNYHKPGETILYSNDPGYVLALSGSILSIRNAGVWRSFILETSYALNAGNLDTGSVFQVGTDYYVYLVDNGSNGMLVLSANSTYPAGQNSTNSRKIGGFHYGCVRRTNSEYVPVDSTGNTFGSNGTAWQQNVVTGILPNSVWDLSNRPRCAPEGMARVGSLWVDIYQSSLAVTLSSEPTDTGYFIAGGALQSRYGQIPARGSIGLTWYNFNELASKAGKRMLTYSEWIRAAYGNPGGLASFNDYGYTATGNTAPIRTGCQANPDTGVYDPQSTVKPYAVSAYNMVDMVGNIQEYVSDTSIWDNSVTSPVWQDVLGTDKGQLYTSYDKGLRTFACGGYWADGVKAGARAIRLNMYAQELSAVTGVRLACDASKIQD